MITNLNDNECLNLLANNYIGYLGYIYIDRPFIVPITYYFDKENDIIIGYSKEGHKTMSMRKYRKVSIQILEKEDSENCNSVLVHGHYKEVSGSEAKNHLHHFTEGIKKLILKKEEKNIHCISDFSHKITTQNNPIIFIISIDEMTGKKITKENS